METLTEKEVLKLNKENQNDLMEKNNELEKEKNDLKNIINMK